MSAALGTFIDTEEPGELPVAYVLLAGLFDSHDLLNHAIFYLVELLAQAPHDPAGFRYVRSFRPSVALRACSVLPSF